MALGANPGNENGADIYCQLPTANYFHDNPFDRIAFHLIEKAVESG
jgi:hypothetical protein